MFLTRFLAHLKSPQGSSQAIINKAVNVCQEKVLWKLYLSISCLTVFRLPYTETRLQLIQTRRCLEKKVSV